MPMSRVRWSMSTVVGWPGSRHEFHYDILYSLYVEIWAPYQISTLLDIGTDHFLRLSTKVTSLYRYK